MAAPEESSSFTEPAANSASNLSSHDHIFTLDPGAQAFSPADHARSASVEMSSAPTTEDKTASSDEAFQADCIAALTAKTMAPGALNTADSHGAAALAALHPILRNNLQALGIVSLTEAQQLAIKQIGQTSLIYSPGCSGNTTAILFAAVQDILTKPSSTSEPPDRRSLRHLVCCVSADVAIQMGQILHSITRNSAIRYVVLSGHNDIHELKDLPDSGVDIIVAVPSKLIALYAADITQAHLNNSSKRLQLHTVSHIAFDGAEKYHDFADQMKVINRSTGSGMLGLPHTCSFWSVIPIMGGHPAREPIRERGSELAVPSRMPILALSEMMSSNAAVQPTVSDSIRWV